MLLLSPPTADLARDEEDDEEAPVEDAAFVGRGTGLCDFFGFEVEREGQVFLLRIFSRRRRRRSSDKVARGERSSVPLLRSFAEAVGASFNPGLLPSGNRA